jgi:hypothetical protein
MCLPIRQLDPKTRRIYAAGNLCLAASLLLQFFFEQSFGHRHHAVFNSLRFLLTGGAIGLLFWFLRRRRCASDPRF